MTKSQDPISKKTAKELNKRVLLYFEQYQRKMPWRETKNPYAIWISEIMLQQTRVSTVIPYYNRWLEKFPTAHTLAEAPLDHVLSEWAGLGYYSRARNLHRAAKEISANHKGQLPQSLEELRKLPGIGRYTAGAIASIAFRQNAPLVDGNVSRLFSRLFCIEDEIKSNTAIKKIWSIAEKIVVESKNPGDYNQGLMELGATVCTPTNPSCEICPLSNLCQAALSDRQGEFPKQKPRIKNKDLPLMEVSGIWVLRKNKLLLARRKPEGLFGGLWEIPQSSTIDTLQKYFGSEIHLESTTPFHTHRQTLSHRRLVINVWPARIPGKIPKSPEQNQLYDLFSWFNLDSLTTTKKAPLGGLSKGTRSILKAMTTSL